MEKKTGIELIAEERATHAPRGYCRIHDEDHVGGELADMAAVYACTHRDDNIRDVSLENIIWGFYPASDLIDRGKSWRTEQPDRITELVKAGALIAAEIDRLNNQ